MFFVGCLLQDYDKCGDGLVTLVPKKNTNPATERRSIWHIISNPLDPTRRTSEDPPIHLSYPPYIGMALKLCTCRLFTPTTCSRLLPGLELNMTFRPYKIQGLPFPLWHQDFASIKINGLESGKPGWHRPHRTSSIPWQEADIFKVFENVGLLSGYSAPFKSAYNDVYTDPSNG